MADTAVKKAVKCTKGTGTSITIDLEEYGAVMEDLRRAAKLDDRGLGKYLRRIIVNLHTAGNLIPGDKA
jgi:hypothetical protein